MSTYSTFSMDCCLLYTYKLVRKCVWGARRSEMCISVETQHRSSCLSLTTTGHSLKDSWTLYFLIRCSCKQEKKERRTHASQHGEPDIQASELIYYCTAIPSIAVTSPRLILIAASIFFQDSMHFVFGDYFGLRKRPISKRSSSPVTMNLALPL